MVFSVAAQDADLGAVSRKEVVAALRRKRHQLLNRAAQLPRLLSRLFVTMPVQTEHRHPVPLSAPR